MLRLDPSGAPIFSTCIGGSYDDFAMGIALDSQGSVYLAGSASSPDFPTSTGAYQTQLKGNSDCFIVKFDSQGNGIFSTFIGGGSDNQAFAIAVDGQGNSYITGETNSDSYPQVNPPFQHSRHGNIDAFVTELSADGSRLVYSTFAGGSSMTAAACAGRCGRECLHCGNYGLERFPHNQRLSDQLPGRRLRHLSSGLLGEWTKSDLFHFPRQPWYR